MKRLLRSEEGFTLAFALLTLVVSSAVLVSVAQFTSSNARDSSRSKGAQTAYALAEAGINNAMAVVSNPTNNALVSTTLPSSYALAAANTSYYRAYEGGTSYWWGTLDANTGIWTIYGKGVVKNPTGPTAADVTRTLSAKTQVVATYSQPLNAQAWNFVYSTKTGDPDGCDVALANSVAISSSLYIAGNLCLANTASIVVGTDLVNVVVQGRIDQSTSSNTIGTSAANLNSISVRNGCRWNSSGAFQSPCVAATHKTYATTLSSAPTVITPPAADFASWYTNATIGPKSPCTTTTGTPPTFESAGSTTMNNSVTPSVNLTPSASYTCTTTYGELSWNNTTKLLTVKGVIFIDGSAYISNGSVNQYNGQASLYLSGTFMISGTAQLCAAIASGNCNFGGWNPNTEMLMIVANGGTTGTNSIEIANSARIEAGLFATNNLEIHNSAQAEGPMIGAEVKFSNSTQIKSFPVINTVPAGTPGNPNVFAEPQPPYGFTG